MNAPSMPLDAQERRNHIIQDIKKSFSVEESFIHRMMTDIFAAKAHENLWRQKFAELERQLVENQAAFTSLSQNLAQVEQRAQVREQELSARASAAEDRLAEARMNEEALRIQVAHAEERASAAGFEHEREAGPSSEADISRMAFMMGVELPTERTPLPAIPAGMPANAMPPNMSMAEHVSRSVVAGMQRWLQERLRDEQEQRLEQEEHDIEAQEQLQREAREQQER